MLATGCGRASRTGWRRCGRLRQAALRPGAARRPVRRMIVEPGARVADFAKAGSDIITVHAEQSATIHLHRLIGQACSRPWPEPLALLGGGLQFSRRLQHGRHRLLRPVCSAILLVRASLLTLTCTKCAHAPGQPARRARPAPLRQRRAAGRARSRTWAAARRARGADPTLHPGRRRSRTWASRRAWCSTRARR
jgi:hypothetical protein